MVVMTRTSGRWWPAMAIGSAMVALATTSMAQPTPTDPDAPEESATGEDIEEIEIVVTAQFREQKLQELPVAASVLTAQDLEDGGVRSTDDFVSLIPNLTFDDSFTYLNSFVVLRGVTQINNADSPVAIIIDGVPQNNQKQFKQRLFDIQQIEVLKGPQGALYGRNAIGGAINIVTKQPTNEFEGQISAGLENGIGYRAGASLSGPVIPDLVLFRVAGSYYRTEGLIENTFLEDNVDNVEFDYSLRGKVTILPTDFLRIDLRASYNDFEAGSSYDTVVNNTPNGGPVPVFRDGDANDIFAPTSDFRGVTEGNVADLSGRIDLELPFATATYILGFSDIEESYRADLDFSNPSMPSGIFGGLNLGQGQDLSVQLFSHELRLVSPDAQRFRWIAGAYYLGTQRDLLTRVFLDADNCAAQFDDGTILVELNENNDNVAWALFGQLEIDLTERLVLQLGGRFDKDEREQTNPNADGATRTSTFEAFQPKIGLSYRFLDNVLGYATYSTGFRSGGFNAPGVVLEGFEDEFLTNYEVGLKTSFWGGRATVNMAGFFSRSDDFQFFFVDVSTGSQIISNIDAVDLFGVDLDITVRAPGGFSFFGGLGVTDSEIRELGNDALVSFLSQSGVDTDNVVGNRSPRTTEVTLNAGAQWTTGMTDWASLLLRATYEYQGAKFWQIDNVDVRDPIHLVGLRFGLDTDYGTVAIWGRNLLNEEYYADFNPAEFAGTGFDLAFQARPRSFGLDISARF